MASARFGLASIRSNVIDWMRFLVGSAVVAVGFQEIAMNVYRKSSWLLALMLLVGTVMASDVALGAEAQLSDVIGAHQNDLQDCGTFDINCDDDNEPYQSGIQPRPTNEPYQSGIQPRATNEPYQSTIQERCDGNTCGQDWWLDDIGGCFGGTCEGDPWNGTSNGCSSLSNLCNDDSFLVNCSYVTSDNGNPVGACDGPGGKYRQGQVNRYEGCYPVSGAGTMAGTNEQTFRCSNSSGEDSGGFSLTDQAALPDGNVVLLLCSPATGTFSSPDEDSCEDAPQGVRYHTCENDVRFLAPMGSNGEWYLCAKW